MAKVDGKWTEDEGVADKERPSQFERGNAFQLRIVVGKEHYGISVGGADGAGASYRAKFSHKIALEDVVCSMLSLTSIQIAVSHRDVCLPVVVLQRMIASRKVKWKKVELIANAPLCPPGKRMKDPCPKWAQGKINFLF